MFNITVFIHKVIILKN